MQEKHYNKKVLNTKEAAEYLGRIKYRTLEKWRDSSVPKGPRYVKIGRCVGDRVCDLDEYVEECVKEPGDDFEV